MIGNQVIIKETCRIPFLRGKLCIIVRPWAQNYVGVKDDFGKLWYIKKCDFDYSISKKLNLL